MHVLRFPGLNAICLSGILCIPVYAQNTYAQDTYAQQPAWPNAFTAGLAEQLIDQASGDLLEGELEAAEKSYSEALQVAKVNHGLISTQQLQPLQGLIATRLTMGKWKSAERQIDYFKWLNNQTYRRDFNSYLEGTAALSNLLLSASADVNNPSSVRYLIASKNLNWLAISAIENRYGEQAIELAPWLYNVVLTHYYQSTLIKRRGMTSFDYKTDGSEIVNGWSLSRNESMRISYRVGLELLERIEELYVIARNDAEVDISPEASAIVRAAMGDWELLFGRESNALAYYRSAWQGMIEAGLSESEADSFFDRPVSLPVTQLATSWQPDSHSQTDSTLKFNAWSPLYPTAPEPGPRQIPDRPDAAEFSARASFNLVPGMTGNNQDDDLDLSLENLRILSATPDNELIRERARFEISLLRFRPRLIAGEPVRLENIELEYLFSPQLDLMTLIDN